MLQKYVIVKLNSRNAQRYKDLGYFLPQDSSLTNSKYGYKIGSELEIKTLDLSKGSKVKVERTCNSCGRKDTISYRDLGSHDFCKKCNNSTSGVNNPFYNKKHTKKSIEKIKNSKNQKDYSNSYEKMGLQKQNQYALKQGYSSYEELTRTVIEYLETYQCGANNKEFLQTVNLGRQAVKNCLKRANRSDLLHEAIEVKSNRLQKDNSLQREKFAISCGFNSAKELEENILNFFDNNKIPPYSDLVQSKFPFISLSKIVQILNKHGRSDLLNTSQSSLETEILEFLKETLPNVEIITNSRSIIKPYELDLYLPTYKLAIEFNGLYWHSSVHKPKNYHLEKRKLCEKAGINLIQINSDEWVLYKPIIQSIIKAKLGLFKNKIHARKCEVRTVSREDSVLFLKENHLMQSSVGFKSIGLYFNNQLVSLLTYKKYKEGIDIARFCNKNNTVVHGGLSKLLKYVKEENSNIKYIQSFVDLRYGTGFSLQRLGFKNEGESLGWKWTDFKLTYNRLQCRANMDSRKLSENEYANELKWFKLYDAGQRKWILRL